MDEDRPISNMPYDECVEVSESEDVPTALSVTPRVPPSKDPISDDEEEEDEDDDDIQTGYHDTTKQESKRMLGTMVGDDETSEEGDHNEHAPPVDGAYNPADFEHLAVSADIKDLFQYITRYTPQEVSLEHKLKPFIPDYIPAVGDIDAFISVPRPDGVKDKLGLAYVDEPCAKQSDPTVLDLQIRAVSKQTTTRTTKVSSVSEAEKNPRAIDNWINSISELHRQKPPPSVHYTKNMPDIDTLMQEWSPEMEEALSRIPLPGADLNCDLKDYVDIICAILDIPIYKNRIHSLHVLFTLYTAFKASQHFQNIDKDKNPLNGSLETQKD